MKVFIRKTANGSEYWDKDAKKTVFYPKGTAPNPDEIQTEGMVGQYAASGKAPVEPPKRIEGPDLESMDNAQLREFAEQNDIDVPGNMKKLETIRQHIIDELNAAADAQ